MLFAYLLGVLTGAMLVVAYGTYEMIKLQRKLKEAAAALKDPLDKLKDKVAKVTEADLLSAEKGQSIRERLDQAQRLAEEQAQLRAMAEMPSKNALHSRHKNAIVGQVFELEAQKISILKTVLGDGFDPIITVLREGGVQEQLSLSEYVAQAEVTMNLNNPYGPTPGTDPEAATNEVDQGPRKAGKFVVYNGGRDDGSGTTH